MKTAGISGIKRATYFIQPLESKDCFTDIL
jgi:hypothetical protein